MPLVLTSDYFQKTISSAQQLTARETGLPSVEAMLQQKSKYWILPAGAELQCDVSKKKRLILNDWGAAQWIPEKRLDIEQMLCELLVMGFELTIGEKHLTYAVDEDDRDRFAKQSRYDALGVDPVKVYVERQISLALDDYCKTPSLIHNQELQESDDDFVLDYFELNRLIRGESHTRRCLYHKDFLQIHATRYFLKYLHHMNQLRPEGVIGCDREDIFLTDKWTRFFDHDVMKQFLTLFPVISFNEPQHPYRDVLYRLSELHNYPSNLNCSAVNIAWEREADENADLSAFTANNTQMKFLNHPQCSISTLLTIKSELLEKLNVIVKDVLTTGQIALVLANNPNLHSLRVVAESITGGFAEETLFRLSLMRSFSIKEMDPVVVDDQDDDGLSVAYAEFRNLLEGDSATVEAAPVAVTDQDSWEIQLRNMGFHTKGRFISMRDSICFYPDLAGDAAACWFEGLSAIEGYENNALASTKRAHTVTSLSCPLLRFFCLDAFMASELTLTFKPQLIGPTERYEPGFMGERLFGQLQNIAIDDIDDRGLGLLKELLRDNRRLRSLSVIGSDAGISDDFLWDLDASQLESLSLWNIRLNGPTLLNLLRRAPFLVYLEIEACSNFEMTDELAAALAPFPKINEFPTLHFGHRKRLQGSASRQRREAGGGSYQLDANTQRSTRVRTFDYERIYFARKGSHPSPTLYRADIDGVLEVNEQPCDADQAFTVQPAARTKQSRKAKPKRSADDLFTSLHNQPNDEFDYYYAKQTIHLTGEDVALTLLHPDEEILTYHLSTDVTIRFRDDTGDDLYYLRVLGDVPEGLTSLEIDYIARVPLERQALPDDVLTIIQKYQGYGEGALNLADVDQPTGQDYLHALQNQNVGACRHRSAACFHELEDLKTRYPSLEVRMPGNVGHAFIEVKYEGDWHTCDLGGYQANLSIDDRHTPPYFSFYLSRLLSSIKASIVAIGSFIFSGLKLIVTFLFYPLIWLLSLRNKPGEDLASDAGTEALTDEAEDEEAPAHTDRTEAAVDTAPTKLRAPMVSSSSLVAWCEALFKRPSVNYEDVDAYVADLIFGQEDEYHNHLVEASSNTVLQGMILRVVQQAIGRGVSVFCIHSPDDLVCAADYITPEGGFAPGPGGPLHDFLIKAAAHPERPAVLLVNYGAFDKDDIPRLNKLLDQTGRYVDETPLPDHLRVLGFMNPFDANAYQANDLYSRFCGNVSRCPFDTEQVNEGLPPAPQCSDDPDSLASTQPLPMFHVPDWESRLFGRRCLQIDHLDFEPGLLADDVSVQGPYVFENMDLDAEGFALKWRMRKLQSEDLSQDYITTGYAWSDLAGCIVQGESDSSIPQFVLNPTLLPLFFHQTQVDNSTETATTEQGILASHAGQTLSIMLTREISEDAWALFLHYCLEHKVKIHVSAVEGVQLPGLAGASQFEYQLPCDEVPETLASDPMVIEASELEGPDLLARKTGRYEDRRFIFRELPSTLKRALRDGRHVVLTGDFSDTLRDALAPLVLERAAKVANLGYLTCQEAAPHVAPEPVELPDITSSALPESSDDIEAESDAFIAHNIETIERLSHTRCGLLVGQTGVGKSTFVRDYWAKPGNYFHGYDQIKAWLTCEEPGIKTLFIDEINAQDVRLALFKGLGRDKPAIYYEGEYYEGLENHFLLGAGNVLSEGGERKAIDLFNDPEQIGLFERMPCSFIYCEVLRPVLSQINVEYAFDVDRVCRRLLSFYTFALGLAEKKILLTPRELLTMALSIRDYCEHHPDAPVNEVVDYYAYAITKTMLPKAYLPSLEAFCPAPDFVPDVHPLDDSTLVWTQSRRILQEQLDAFLGTRAYPEGNAGLSMCILEGPSGIGKSELLDDYLQHAHGFSKLALGETQSSDSKQVYWQMPAGLSIDKRRQYLAEAYDLGYVVVVDEINSIALGEGFLNSLFNKPPAQHGFRIIGTQNESFMPGRRQQTNPEVHRTWKIVLPAYEEDELVEIITHDSPKLPLHAARALATGFKNMVSKARHQSDAESPTIRNMLDRVQCVLEYCAVSVLQLAYRNGFFARAQVVDAVEGSDAALTESCA